MTRLSTTIVLAVACGSLPGCASTKPTAARGEVSDLVSERAGLDDALADQQQAESRAEVQRRVDELLSEPLTPQRAALVALLNNQHFLAELEQLGVAQADLVEAGLLQNPMIGGDLVVSTQGNGLGGGLSLSQSLLSAFLIPAKRRLAKAQLQHAVVTAGNAALELVRDTKLAHADLEAAVAVRDLHRTLTQAAEVADELAARQFEAGNITDLQREQIAFELDERRLELADKELEVGVARESLNELLGLWGERTQWKLGKGDESWSEPLADLSQAERQGIRDRLDVSAARYEVEAIGYALKLRRRGVIGEVEAGLEARNEVGNDEGHEWVVGPSMAIELPLFDPGHADFARLRAQLRQAQYRLRHLAISARAEIRTHRRELDTARTKVVYLAETVVPRRKTIDARSLEQYNAMLMGAYDLLEVRVEAIEIRHELAEAIREYRHAQAHLDYAVGGSLDPQASG